MKRPLYPNGDTPVKGKIPLLSVPAMLWSGYVSNTLSAPTVSFTFHGVRHPTDTSLIHFGEYVVQRAARQRAAPDHPPKRWSRRRTFHSFRPVDRRQEVVLGCPPDATRSTRPKSASDWVDSSGGVAMTRVTSVLVPL